MFVEWCSAMENEKRLIDAKELAEKIYEIRFRANGIRNGKTLLLEFAEKYRDEILRIICKAPTVDAVEVVHARWLDYQGKTIAEGEKNYYWTCSNCKKTLKFEDYPISLNEEDFPLNYCPNCGAKMDGGNEDG